MGRYRADVHGDRRAVCLDDRRALLAHGITALIFGGDGFTQNAPSGAVDGKTWLGLEINGWSGLLFVAAGLLLLLGAPMHWGAKSMSLIVGISLAALCLIALANGHGALGIFAAKGLTELVWGAAGALLIVLSLAAARRRQNQTLRPSHTRADGGRRWTETDYWRRTRGQSCRFDFAHQ